MKKILVVEDYEPILNAYARLLEDYGYKCTLAGNGKEAIEKILQEKPDLVLTDFEMPVMDGYELCRKIREDPKMKDLYIIMSSGANLPKGIEGYINESIPKGNSEKLVSRIKEILGGNKDE